MEEAGLSPPAQRRPPGVTGGTSARHFSGHCVRAEPQAPVATQLGSLNFGCLWSLPFTVVPKGHSLQ